MTAALRVGVIVARAWPWPGGVETHVAELAQRLAASGVNVHVFTSTDGSAPLEEAHDGYVIRRFPLPSRKMWDLPSPRMLTAIRAQAPHLDVLHAHSYHALPALYAAVGKGPTPLVFTPHYHGTGHTPTRAALHKVYRPIGKLLVGRSDHVIAVSTAERDLLVQDFGAQLAQRITVIPNGVDAVTDVAEPFRRPRRTVLTTSRLEGYKSVDTLVRMMTNLPSDVELVIIGEGPERATLEALAASLGVSDRVSLVGRVSDEELGRWRATAVTFVSASKHEAFGITVAEALSLGLPVVVSDIPAHREVAQLAGDSERTFFVPPAREEPTEFARQVTRALAFSPARRPSRMPSWDEVAIRTRAVYDLLLGSPVGH